MSVLSQGEPISSTQYPNSSSNNSGNPQPYLRRRIQYLNRRISHCHEEEDLIGIEAKKDEAKTARQKLINAAILCFVFMIAEIIGGVISNSLAVMTDALHLVTDLAGYGISIAAITLSQRKATQQMTFGYKRAEVVGAFISILLIWLITAVLVFMAVLRIIQGNYEVEAPIMLITSSLGVGINLTMGIQLEYTGDEDDDDDGKRNTAATEPTGEAGTSSSFRRSIGQKKPPQPAISLRNLRKSTDVNTPSNAQVSPISSSERNSDDQNEEKQINMNVKAAIIHILGDLGQSVGVMVAALIIFFEPSFAIADPICTFIFAAFVMATTFTMVREIFHVLMEGAPGGVQYAKVHDDFLAIDGVEMVHNLRIWTLNAANTACSAHICVRPLTNYEQHTELLESCRKMLREKHGITDITLQMEQHTASVPICPRCQQAETVL